MSGAARPPGKFAVAASIAAPCLICLLVFQGGLRCWFQQDDFAWLGLRNEFWDFPSLITVLFSPKAQGTIRPLSERAFFMTFSWMFGLDALPFRILVFATQLLTIGLLVLLTRRITGSLLAGAFAASLWTINSALAIPLSWTSAYNQVMCAAFITGAMLLFAKWIETGERRFYVWQWVVFLIGFGVLEHNVAYPLLAGAYAVLRAPKRVWAVALMAVVSAVYAFIHRTVAPGSSEGVYATHFDSSMVTTLGSYWRIAFGGTELAGLELPAWLEQLGHAAPVILSIPLASFLGYRIWKRQWMVLLPVAWFLILLAPVLPVRDHITDYYLTMPTMGLAMLGGWALAAALRSGLGWRVLAFGLAGCYAITTIPDARGVVEYRRARSVGVRDLVLGVGRAHELHPGKIILLAGVGTELFWSTVNDNPFHLVGADYVYLVPGSEDLIQRFPDLGDPDKYVFPSGHTLRALEAGRAVVYAAGERKLRNITKTYIAVSKPRLKPGLAHRIDAGNPEFADQLGTGWHPADNGYRWTSKQATVILSGPERRGQKLWIEGFCPAEQLAAGPLTMSITLEGKPLGEMRIGSLGAFTWSAELPGEVVGKERIEFQVGVDRVVGEAKDPMGLAFGSFYVR
ncbi:MAG: hypothetical protein U0Q16_01260 [Bryobacteraceae bacterium]